MNIGVILEYLNEINTDYTFKGDSNKELLGFSSLRSYKSGTFTWIRDNETFKNNIIEVETAFVSEDFTGNVANKIICKDPKKLFFNVLHNFYKKNSEDVSIGVHTYISSNVSIGENVVIGSNCTINGDVVIGNNTKIFNGVSIIGSVSIGENCIIKSGVVIGHGDLDYIIDEFTKERIMVEQFGGVEIGNDVWIGPNSVINKGTLDNTRIGDNVIVDGLCYISHNVILEDNVVVIAGTKLFGSSIVNKNCYVSTSVIRNQTTIGEGAMIGMGSVVTKDVVNSSLVYGNPAKFIKNI